MIEQHSTEIAAHNELIINCMCCIIASDGKVVNSEIDVVHDALAGIGHQTPIEDFKSLVINSCKTIYKHGALNISDRLALQLSRITNRAVAEFILELQDEVITADDVVTPEERIIAQKFRNALLNIPDCQSEDGSERPGSMEKIRRSDHGDWNLLIKRNAIEFIAYLIHETRTLVDNHIGSRVFFFFNSCIAVAAITLTASFNVFLTSIVTASFIPTMLFALFLGSDRNLFRIAYKNPIQRWKEREIDDAAHAFISEFNLEENPEIKAQLCDTICSASESDVPTNDNPLFQQIFDLLGGRRMTYTRRARIARRVEAILASGKAENPEKSSCGTEEGSNEPRAFSPLARRLAKRYFFHRDKLRSFLRNRFPKTNQDFSCDRIIRIRGYVNKNGTWVQPHYRSRPGRRRRLF